MSNIDYDLLMLVSNGFPDEGEAAAAFLDQLRCAHERLQRSSKLDDTARLSAEIAYQNIVSLQSMFFKFFEDKSIHPELSWRMKVRLITLMDSLMQIGSANSIEYAGVLHSALANENVENAAAEKNQFLRECIIEEAGHQRIELKASEACARRLEPGIWKRANVAPNAEGYNWPSIRRQIAIINKAKKVQT